MERAKIITAVANSCCNRILADSCVGFMADYYTLAQGHDSRIRSVGRADLPSNRASSCSPALLRASGRGRPLEREREREYFPTFRKYLPFHIWNFCRCCCIWRTRTNERFVGVTLENARETRHNFLEVILNGAS